MSRTPNKISGTLAAVLCASALAPAVGVAQAGGLNGRTATEIGQAVGEPGERGNGTADALYSRTPTELAQTAQPPAAPEEESSGFDWGDAAVGALAASGLILTALAAARSVRRSGGPGRPRPA